MIAGATGELFLDLLGDLSCDGSVDRREVVVGDAALAITVGGEVAFRWTFFSGFDRQVL